LRNEKKSGNLVKSCSTGNAANSDVCEIGTTVFRDVLVPGILRALRVARRVVRRVSLSRVQKLPIFLYVNINKWQNARARSSDAPENARNDDPLIPVDLTRDPVDLTRDPVDLTRDPVDPSPKENSKRDPVDPRPNARPNVRPNVRLASRHSTIAHTWHYPKMTNAN